MNVRERWKEAPIAMLALGFGAVLLAAFVVFELSTLAMPIDVFEGHHWRQSFTYSVAWNFAHGSLDVLHPRMWVELARSNVVPMEAPLYPFVAGLLMRVSGDSLVGPRLLSIAGLLVTVRVLWAWLDDPKTPADRAGLLVALAMTPMTSVLFRSVQPEAAAAGLAIAAGYVLARSGARGDLVKGSVLLGLSLLAKPLALGVIPALFLLALRHRPWRRSGWVVLAFVVASAPWIAWDRWAHHLLTTELGGNWVIEIVHPPGQLLKTLLHTRHGFALLHQLPSYASSWWLPPAIATGLYRGLADRRLRRTVVTMLVWMVGAMIEILAVAERLGSNAYYLAMALAPMAYLAALGLGALVRVLDASKERVSVTVFRAGVACLVLAPIGTAFSRPSPDPSFADPATLGFERNAGVWTSDLGVARMFLVFVVVLALAPLVRRRIAFSAALPVFLVSLVLVWRPVADAHQYARYHLGMHRRDGLDAEIGRLRAEIDRWTTASDRILLSPGGTYREPTMVGFQVALRNGFPISEPVTAERLDELRRRGARVWLHIDRVETTRPPRGPTGRLLASGAWWRLWCVASDGCLDPPIPR